MRKILISNGPTRIYLDPVRYITNISSGKMGLALASAAAKFAEVCVVSANVDLPYPKNVQVTRVETNQEMLSALTKKIEWADIFISVAAVVDFEPTQISIQKIKKTQSLELKNSVDILKTLALKKRADQIMIGFALETENLLTNAEKKLQDKNLDFIIANRAEESMGLDFASVTILAKDGSKKVFEKMKKDELAEKILEYFFYSIK